MLALTQTRWERLQRHGGSEQGRPERPWHFQAKAVYTAVRDNYTQSVKAFL